MKKTYILYLASLCFFGCMQTENKTALKLDPKPDSNKVVFISDNPNSALQLLYFDEFDDQIKITLKGPAKTENKYAFAPVNPVFLFDYSLNQTYYIVYPNEKIIFHTTTTEDSLSVNIEKQTTVRQNEVNFFQKLASHELENAAFLKGVKKSYSNSNINKSRSDARFSLLMEAIKRKKLSDGKNALKHIVSKYDNRKKFLADYSQQRNLSDNFKKLVNNYFNADFHSDYYQLLTQAFIKKKPLDVSSDSLTRTITKVTKSDTNFFIPSVTKRLKAYLQYNFLTENKLSTKDKLAFIERELQGKVKTHAQFLVFKSLNFEQKSQEIAMLNNYAKANPNYASYISQNLQQKLQVDKTILLDKNGDELLLDELINKYKGKILLIDFWASWCAPCVAEFPNSKKLRNELKNRDVVFIYLSTDDKYNIWHKSDLQYNLGPNSYLIKNQAQSDLIGKLKVTSIPRYIIINKKGTIVNSNAERPSSSLLKKQLMAYLN